MKKAIVSILIILLLSCVSDDANSEIYGISFNLDEISYFLTNYSVTLDPIDENYRVINASFNENSSSIQFRVLVEETNQIDEFIYTENAISYVSDENFGSVDRETSITVHTASEMVGTFELTMLNARNQPEHLFTEGTINIRF